MEQREDFHRRLRETDALVAELEAVEDEAARTAAVSAIQALLRLHGDVLERVLEILEAAGEPGRELIGRLSGDDAVAGLLLLHGLHPVSLEARVEQALDRVRPYLASHGGSVELVDVSPAGAVTLRLAGSCDGCASSAQTMEFAIEEAIAAAAPEATSIEVEGAGRPPPSGGFVPLAQIQRPQENASGWQAVTGLESVEPGRAAVLPIGGRDVLFARVDGTWYAYSQTCPRCGRSFGGVEVEAAVLPCPGCGLRFDLRGAGRCLDPVDHRLQPLPLLEEAGQVRVATGGLA